jgi:hypothetical protein
MRRTQTYTVCGGLMICKHLSYLDVATHRCVMQRRSSAAIPGKVGISMSTQLKESRKYSVGTRIKCKRNTA